MDSYQSRLFSLIQDSKEGVALFNNQDVLVFANAAFIDFMYVLPSDTGVATLTEILQRNFDNKCGVKVKDNNIDSFIEYVKAVRRSQSYRSFEVDYVDNRWFLISEQISQGGDLLMQIKDITKQKVIEQDLQWKMSKYQKMALTDELTGLANRRALKDSVASEIARIERSSAAATLLVVDLDHFKKVNDTYGHQCGDEALAHCAQIMKATLRPSDTVGRIGGEEFAVFLADTNTRQGEEVAQRIRAAIFNNPVKLNKEWVTLSVSIGLATMKSNVSFDTLYVRADEALYAAKTDGRNCVRISHLNSK